MEVSCPHALVVDHDEMDRLTQTGKLHRIRVCLDCGLKYDRTE
jgi:hypothetical protein